MGANALQSFCCRRWGRQERRALAYGMTNFSAAVLHNIFVTYYVDLALNVSHVSEGWFMAAQMLYCVWNSVNDPACGWWADTHTVQGLRRLPRIRKGGPLWALSFVAMWYPWADGRQNPTLAGLHLIFCLAMYDGWLSYTLVNHQALLADMTTENSERELCNMVGAACQMLGSFAIFFAQLFWDAQSLATFQRFAVVASAISCIGFYVTVSSPDISERRVEKQPGTKTSARADSDTPSLVTFARQTLQHRSYWVFIVMSLLQQFSCTFNTNFFSLFLVALVGRSLSPTMQAFVVYTGFVAPHMGTILLTPVLGWIGKKRVIQGLFVARAAAAVGTAAAAAALLPGLSLTSLLFSTGSDSLTPAAQATVLQIGQPSLAGKSGPAPAPLGVGDGSDNLALVAALVAGLWLNRVLTENVCRLQPLVVTDLIDEDTVMHRRSQSMSSMMFGSVALFTKPGQSLAPMFGAFVLARHTEPADVWFAVLRLVTCVPLVLAVAEAAVWARYALDGARLRWVKSAIRVQLPGDLPLFGQSADFV
eukprot:TRINITY_DN20578_c0_g1_i1.p1 TRINITY_DN20578_c0_g1~~TRINITY_DN20578_c0_g1_i1.p1  ORF type:complete len:535 (+),score=155.93 TRINITY_DN20578_c0_g1_i1:56-1660(+)